MNQGRQADGDDLGGDRLRIVVQKLRSGGEDWSIPQAFVDNVVLIRSQFSLSQAAKHEVAGPCSGRGVIRKNTSRTENVSWLQQGLGEMRSETLRLFGNVCATIGDGKVFE